MNYEQLLQPWHNKLTMLDDEIASLCKQYRNQCLAASDYTQLPDVDLVNKFDWAVYRQELRDLPQQGPDPKLWVFPEPPK